MLFRYVPLSEASRKDEAQRSRGWFHTGKGALARARCPPVAAASSSSLIQPASASLAAAFLPHPPATAVATRDHRRPLALVLISHDPDAARGAFRSFGFSITVPITSCQEFIEWFMEDE